MIPAQKTKQLVKIPSGQTLSSLVLSIKVLDASKIKIYRDNVQVTAYSVSGSTITFNPAIAGACTLSVMSDEPIAREFDITKATEWNAATVNRQLDELQLQVQQVCDSIGLVLQPSDDKPYTPADMQDIVNTTIASKDIAVTKASEAKASATSAASSASSALKSANNSKAYMDESRRFMEQSEAIDLGYFRQDAVGSVDRAFVDKVRETVSVKDFGAVGDGVADDTAAIQNTLDAFNHVIIPSGNYLVKKSILIRSNQHLLFQGNAKLIAGVDDLIVIANPQPTYFTKIINCYIDGNGKSNVCGMSLANFRLSAVIDNAHIESAKIGIDLYSGCWDLVINNPTLRNVDNPIRAQVYGGSLVINHPAIDTFADVGILLYRAVGKDTASTQINGGYIQNGKIGIMDLSYRTVVNATYFEACTDADVMLGSTSFYFVAHGTTHLGGVGNVCFRGRSAKSAIIENPFMSSYARKIGLFDFDESNENCKCEVISSKYTMNQPVGITGGIADKVSFYRYGTFIPVIAGSGVAGDATYTSQAGTYILVGNLLCFTLSVTWSGHSGTGNTILTGIPIKGSPMASSSVVAVISGFPTTYAQPFLYIGSGEVSLRYSATTGNVGLIPLPSGGQILATGQVFLSDSQLSFFKESEF